MAAKKPKAREKLDELWSRVELLQQTVNAAIEQHEMWKASMHRIERRIEFLDQHVTATNVRSLTIRLGQVETNLTAVRDSINMALFGLKGR